MQHFYVPQLLQFLLSLLECLCPLHQGWNTSVTLRKRGTVHDTFNFLCGHICECISMLKIIFPVVCFFQRGAHIKFKAHALVFHLTHHSCCRHSISNWTQESNLIIFLNYMFAVKLEMDLKKHRNMNKVIQKTQEWWPTFAGRCSGQKEEICGSQW